MSKKKFFKSFDHMVIFYNLFSLEIVYDSSQSFTKLQSDYLIFEPKNGDEGLYIIKLIF